MFIYLLILLIAIPVLEIIIFIEIGSFVGTFNTILLTFLTAIVGVYLVRQQGLSTIRKIMVQLQSGERPVVTMFEGLVILVAGVLLLTPGFFTDTIGFLGLIPVTRTLMIRLVQTTMMKRYNVHQDDTIEGEYIDYYSFGQILSKRFYVNNQLEGIYKEFYKNGQLHIKKNYKNNITSNFNVFAASSSEYNDSIS